MDRKDRSIAKSDRNQNQNLQKLANVFHDGFSLTQHQYQVPTPRSSGKKNSAASVFKVPLHGPNTQTRNPGQPIDVNTARGLRLAIVGSPSQPFTSDWKKFFFAFRNPKSKLPYGLDASLPGPRALALCAQAYILKNLMFSSEKPREETYFGKESPRPSTMEQDGALVDAVVDILWKAALPLARQTQKHQTNNPEKKQVIVTLVGHDPCFQTKGNFIGDGFTEKLWLYTLNTRNDVRKFVRRNIHYFCERIYPGGIMLLYSVVLSRTFDVIMKDMGQRQKALLTDNARSTQALVNLLLTGNAAPYVHNGVIRCDGQGKALDRPLPGIRSRSEVGFLFFNKQEHEKRRTQVGSMYKTPLVPIWVTQVNGTFGLLFCTSRDLVTDWKTERYFTLHYYNGHVTQQTETVLTIDTRTRVDSINPDKQISIWDDEEEVEKKQPSLELLIFTKWPEADVDWSGETPYY
ncbi:inactive ubiquitin carboxyl-terminal hydrolase MINDY-4B-like [Clavelina lepadiformis]|uniref:inactive ubiquitin carboxyl-terminal hydrolase MINDY-4B-like n=1 Tax=Clavelina lepadiformis TaxID=159417 RepID=UPI004041EF0E